MFHYKTSDGLSVWYKTKFGSQILATDLGAFFVIQCICNIIRNMFSVGLIIMWSTIVVEGFLTSEIWALENLEGYQMW